MLEEKLFDDYKKALKEKDSVKSSTLSFLRAELMNAVIEKKKKTFDDNNVIAVIKKQIKQRQDSIEQFQKGNRQDLADKEIRELEILKAYLPEQLTSDEIKKIIAEVTANSAAQGLKDMGRVMKEVIARVGQAADSKLVSDLVRERLSKPD